MTRFLLDTSFLIDFLNDRRDRATLMDTFINERHDLACCAITVTEVFTGMRGAETRKTEALLRSLAYIPIHWDHAKLAGDLRQFWARKGKTLSVPDMMIAALCITENLTLVTDNRKHFPMPEISLFPLP